MKPDRIHLLLGLFWLLAGMILGEAMGRTGDHSQMPTHAHIMLVGGVLPVLWALLYRGFGLSAGLLAWVQLGLHHLGALAMIVALFMLYGGMATEAALGPVLGISAFALIIATALIGWQAIRAKG